MQVGTYVFLDGNYADAVLRRDEPHPFTSSLTVRATVISNAQPGFVITDAGVKELVGMGAGIAPRVLTGVPAGSGYRIVGDDMGRLDLRPGAPAPAVGARRRGAAAVLLPHGRPAPLVPLRARRRAGRHLAGGRAGQRVAAYPASSSDAASSQASSAAARWRRSSCSSASSSATRA